MKDEVRIRDTSSFRLPPSSFFALAGYLALALAFTWPLATEFGSAIPGDGFDGLQNYWNLWWVRRALLELQTTPFFTHDLFFPAGASLYFHTLNIFNGLWTLPVQLLGGLAVSYNAVVLFTFVLSGYGTWLLTKDVLRQTAGGERLTADGKRQMADKWQINLAAFVAGFVFAFAPVRMAHLLGHMQVLSSEWLPFFVLAYWRMATHATGNPLVRSVRGTRGGIVDLLKRAMLPAVFLVLNALCDWYFVLYAMVFVGLVVVWQWVGILRAANGKQVSKSISPETVNGDTVVTNSFVTHAWLKMLLAPVRDALAVGVLFAILLSPVLVPMVGEAAGASEYLRPPYEETVQLSADLAAFVTPSEFNPIWGESARSIADQFTSSTSERTVFAGYAVLALAIVGVWRFRQRVAFWVLMVGAFFALALGPYLHVFGTVVSTLPLPYAWLYALVPFVRITRSVSRFDLMVMLALGVLAACGVMGLWVAKGRLGEIRGDKGNKGDAGGNRGAGQFRIYNLKSKMVVTGLCIMLGVEFWTAPYPMWPLQVPAFYAQLAQEPGEFAILELPINWDRPDPLLYQTVHGHPLITAYTSRSNPLSVVEQTPVLNLLRTLEPDIIQYDVRAVGASVLSDLGVRYVINHPLTMGAGDERTVTNRVLQQVFGSRAPVVNEPNLVVYRVTPPATHVPYIVLGDGWGGVTVRDGVTTRRVERQATLRLPGLPSGPVTLRLTVASESAPGHLSISDNGSDLGRLGISLTLTQQTTTYTVALPATTQLWLFADTPVSVRAVELISNAP